MFHLWWDFWDFGTFLLKVKFHAYKRQPSDSAERGKSLFGPHTNENILELPQICSKFNCH